MLTTSVVISTYDRVDGMIRLLNSINTQSVLPETVIVVDQSKGDRFKKAIAEFLSKPETRIKVDHQPVTFQGLTRSRNYGLSRVRTPIVTFLDDDVELDPGYFEKVIPFFENKKGVILSGLIQMPDVPHRGGPYPGMLWTIYRKIFGLSRPADRWKILANFEVTYCSKITQPTEAEYITGSNFSVLTDVANRIRFDENLIWYSIGEDIDFPFRVRKQYPQGVWLDPTLPVKHPLPPARPLSEFLLLVHTCHHYYLFQKMWDRHPSFGAYAQFIWGRVGAVMMPALQTRKIHFFPTPELFIRSLKVEWKVLKHFSEVFDGKFPVKI